MENLRPDIQQIKQLSGEIMKLEETLEQLNQNLNQYKTSVSGYIHKIRRAESLLEFDNDPEISSITEATNQKVKTMEDKIQGFVNQIEIVTNQYDILFEKRRTIVQKVDRELNKEITYAYPFGTDSPTIRMGRFYHITEEGDVSCRLVYESNSVFDPEFHEVI